jgi:hypothetical protein
LPKVIIQNPNVPIGGISFFSTSAIKRECRKHADIRWIVLRNPALVGFLAMTTSLELYLVKKGGESEDNLISPENSFVFFKRNSFPRDKPKINQCSVLARFVAF